ncbi:MAG: helix-turn-helix transcriptional regulator [Chloroflexi bacterium]|nr:helix-turn-helix transcriptional regulator [Chloroflexota bacterium]
MPVESFWEDLEKRLQNPGFRRAYGAEDVKSSIAFLLREARTEKGLSQKEFAERAQVSQAYIAKLERGDANPTIGHMGELLALLWRGVDLESRPLLRGQETGGIRMRPETGTSALEDAARTRRMDPQSATTSAGFVGGLEESSRGTSDTSAPTRKGEEYAVA